MAKRLLALLLAGFFAFSGQISAFADPKGMEETLFGDIPVVYTASKQAESQLTAPGTIYVVTDEEIKRFGYRDLVEILHSLPNIETLNDYTQLKGGMRGFAGTFNHTQILLDGRDFTHIFADEIYVASNFPASRIKRVEVLMGPNSTLYGSGAQEGVINIITKIGDGQPDAQEASIMSGAGHSNEVSGMIRKTSGDAGFGFFASRYKRLGDIPELAAFNANTSAYSRNALDATRDLNPNDFNLFEEDYNYDATLRWKALYAGMDMTEITRHSEMLQTVSINSGDYNKNRAHSLAYAGVKGKTDKTDSFLEFRRTDERVQNTNPTSVGLTTFTVLTTDLHRNQLVGQTSYKLDQGPLATTHQFVAGFDYYSDDIFRQELLNSLWGLENETTPGLNLPQIAMAARGVNRRWRTNIFLQDTIGMWEDKVRLVVGGLYDNSKFMRENWVPRGSLIYSITPHDVVKYTYGEGFQGPSYFDIRNVATATGQFIFLPNRMRMHEINYSSSHRLGGVLVSPIVSVYDMKSAAVTTSGAGAVWTSVEKRTTVKGAETQVKASVDRLSGFIGGRIVDPQKQRSATGTDLVLDVPLTELKAGVSYDVWKKVGAALFLERWSKVRDDANKVGGGTEVVTIPSWTVLNLNVRALEVELGPQLTGDLGFYVGNLTNKAYYVASNTNLSPVKFLQMPRNYRVTASVKF